MDKPWEINATGKVLFELYGRDRQQLILASIHSVWRRMAYARLLYHDAQSLADTYIDQNLKEVPLLLAVHNGDSGPEKFDEFIYRAGAYITAFAQNLHAVADTFAYAIYHALDLNQLGQTKHDRKLYARTVHMLLASKPEFEQLGRLLQDLTHGGGFQHLTALVNHSKHCALVLTALTEDWSGQAPKRHRLQLAAFRHKKKSYPEVDVEAFFSEEWDRVYKICVDMGIELHTMLLAQLAARPT